MYYLIEIVIIRLNRLGWTQEKIAEIVGLSQNRISEIIGNTNFGEIDNLLSQGRAMDYIAVHYHMDIALAWAIYLEGKRDQKKFKALGWELRTWDHWNFNEFDERFGDDWPGRIPAQLVAHTLFYFPKPRVLGDVRAKRALPMQFLHERPLLTLLNIKS